MNLNTKSNIRPEDRKRADKILEEIEILKKKINSVGLFEDVDLRFRKSEKIEVKTASAVFIMVMDISGSMDEAKKRMARKLFSLQYAFIKKSYPDTDIIFVAHTEQAYEMTEEEFFTTRINGGTVVSPAFALVLEIIKQRYDASKSNIYLSFASDGDNYAYDNAQVKAELEDNGLLSMLRHMVYAQVGESYAAGFSWGSNTLEETFKQIAENNKKFQMVKISNEDQVFDAFKNIYKKRN